MGYNDKWDLMEKFELAKQAVVRAVDWIEDDPDAKGKGYAKLARAWERSLDGMEILLQHEENQFGPNADHSVDGVAYDTGWQGGKYRWRLYPLSGPKKVGKSTAGESRLANYFICIDMIDREKKEILFSVVYDFAKDEMFSEIYDRKVEAVDDGNPSFYDTNKGDIVMVRERLPNHDLTTPYFEVTGKLAEGSNSDVYLVKPINSRRKLAKSKALTQSALNYRNIRSLVYVGDYQRLPKDSTYKSHRSFRNDPFFVLKQYFLPSEGDFTTISQMEELAKSARQEYEEKFEHEHGPAYDFVWADHEKGRLQKLNNDFPGLFPEMIAECRLEFKFLREGDSFRKTFPSKGMLYEYCGPTLAERIRDHDLADKEKVDVCNRLFKSIYALQTLGWIHKDLSLSNVCVGRGGLAKVIDLTFAQDIGFKHFYLGKSIVEELAKSNDEYPFNTLDAFPGNRLWSPPEVHDGYLSPRFDVWSAGLLAFTTFTGEHLIPVMGSGEILMHDTKISKEIKRQYFADIGKLVKKGRTGKRKLQHVIDERLEHSDVPDKYKPAISRCCRVSQGTRPNMVKILGMLNLRKPIRKRRD